MRAEGYRHADEGDVEYLVRALKDIEMESRPDGQWTREEINEVARNILREIGALK